MAQETHTSRRQDRPASLIQNGAFDRNVPRALESLNSGTSLDHETPSRIPSADNWDVAQKTAARGRTLDRVSVAFSLVAAIIGLVTIVGWITGMESLTSLRARYIPMAPSTALCFTLLGFAIVTHSRAGPLRVASRACTAFVALVAAAKLVEFLGGRPLGLDELLVADPAMFGVVRKGRMASITALDFLLSTLALACLVRTSWRRYAGFVATLVATISVVVLLGYMHGTPLLYGGSLVPVALPTAGAFLFLGVSLIATAGQDCWPVRPLLGSSARSLLLRWFLPVVIAGTIANGYLQSRFLNEPDINPALVSALSTLGFALLISAVISQVSRIVGGRIDRAEAGRMGAQNALQALNAELEQRIAARVIELRLKNEEAQRLFADLTRSHENLKQAQLQLIQAEKIQSVGSLAAGIAHEVKNPLAILEMGLGCLASQPNLDAATVRLVHLDMKNAVARANEVISGLLDYSSSKELAIRACDLHTVLTRALHLVQHELIKAKITVSQEFAPDLPDCEIDPQMVEQVFVNLFTNACHAMPDGGVLTVTTSVRTVTAAEVHWEAGDRSGSGFRVEERVAMVMVRDTGAGISPDQLGKVFDPFFTTKPTGQGTGLGLTVAARIVELHGGRLELANNGSGGGALATVMFHLR